MGWGTYKFTADTLRQVTRYSADWVLYKTRQELQDDIDRARITDKIRDVFVWHSNIRLSMECLRAIDELIEAENI